MALIGLGQQVGQQHHIAIFHPRQALTKGLGRGFGFAVVRVPHEPTTPGADWTKAQGHSIILIPRIGDTIDAQHELVEFADAVVVSNPAPRKRLVRVAEEVGKPVRFYGMNTRRGGS